MNHSLSDRRLLQLSEFVAAGIGLHFPRDRWSELERRTISAAGDFGFTDTEALIEWLFSSPLTREQIEILASHLTIAETYFWREPKIFEALCEQILPELVRSRKEQKRSLRIWSAGCASGEEPYSIAIALRRVIPAAENRQVTIMATDINPQVLRKAVTGVYTGGSFRNEPPWLKKEYFNRNEDGRFEVRPYIRKMVTFAYLNLAKDIYPSPMNNTNAMDLIFCRNVLMYFSPEHALRIIESLHRSLVDGGWLIVSANELSRQTFLQFKSVNFPGAVAYRKELHDELLHQEALVHPLIPIFTEVKQSPLLPLDICEEKASDIVKPSLPENVYADHMEPCISESNKEALRTFTCSIRDLANQGRLTEALTACEEALMVNKLDAELHYLRAIILQEQKMEDEATASFKAALYLEPNFALAHFALGNLMLHKGNRRAAKKCFDNVLSLLSRCHRDEILPESEGLTAGRFKEIIHATMEVWN
jgi:chemotaxis protein methyltransferase CheR